MDALSNCKEVELFLNGAVARQKDHEAEFQADLDGEIRAGHVVRQRLRRSGKVVAETKVETTGDAREFELTPDRKTINADGEDVAVFTVPRCDAQGRVVPVAQNKIDFAIEGAGKIIGVGNGDPSCHEPDTFVADRARAQHPRNEWRWKRRPSGKGATTSPELAADFDDSGWNTLQGQGGGEASTITTENTAAVYRAHVKLTAEDLDGPASRSASPAATTRAGIS